MYELGEERYQLSRKALACLQNRYIFLLHFEDRVKMLSNKVSSVLVIA